MGDFRTVIFYKSEDAMDGVDFDNPHQYDCIFRGIPVHFLAAY